MAEGVRKRGKTWSYYFDAAKTAGERNKIEKGGFKTQKEAMAARASAIAEYNNTGRTFTPSTMSVADYLDYWLENAIRKNIDHGYSYNTYLDYETKIRIHLKPAFGAYRLSSFQYAPDKIQEWVDDMKIRGYSRSMIKNTLACLSGALNYAALPLKYIQANPCTPVKIGKMPINVKAKEHTEYICPKAEFDRIIQRFPEGSNFYLSLIVPYYIGTRISETFAIDLLDDVNFHTGEISINHQLVKIDKTWFYKPPKYDSYRTIKAGNYLIQQLRTAVTERKKDKLKYGPQYIKTYQLPDSSIVQAPASMELPYREIMPLCVKDNGTLLTPESFKYCAKIIHVELGNPLFHSHCLRHTHGTILAEKGISPRTVMERLGHKDVKTTLQTYTFNTDVMQQSAVTAFDEYMLG